MDLYVIAVLIPGSRLLLYIKNRAGNTFNHPAINRIQANTFKEHLTNESSPQLIDVRTPQEFNRGFIKGAVNINMMSSGFLQKMSPYKKDQPVYVYCRSGSRSLKAAQRLAKEGFTEIYNLEGGILAWNKQ